jgi:hypothetical protein
MKNTWTFAFAFLLAACAADPGHPAADGAPMIDAATGDAAGNSCNLQPPANAEFLCEPQGSGACQNCGDCQLVEDGTAARVSAQCGSQCQGSSSPTCAKDCLQQNSTLTGGCATCLNDYFNCLVAHCLAQCIGGASQACTDCSRTQPMPGPSCSDTLIGCSGISRNPNYMP